MELNPERERQRRYEKANREKNRERVRRWRAANAFTQSRSPSHGKTRAEIYAIVMQQGGCAICKKQPTGIHAWHGDHDHKTGAFRGVLCRACNVGLGHFKDKVKLLREAIYYLESHAHRRDKLKDLL